jgi:hypothetical protein
VFPVRGPRTLVFIFDLTSAHERSLFTSEPYEARPFLSIHHRLGQVYNLCGCSTTTTTASSDTPFSHFTSTTTLSD